MISQRGSDIIENRNDKKKELESKVSNKKLVNEILEFQGLMYQDQNLN